jgi:predicted ester cyclase
LPDDGLRGPGKFQQMFGLWQTAFPDWRMTIEELVSEGDIVVTRRTSTGTHLGPLFGHQPTGRRIEIEGTDVHQVVGGLVVESWIADDAPRILLQLGIIPPLPIAAQAGVNPVS